MRLTVIFPSFELLKEHKLRHVESLAYDLPVYVAESMSLTDTMSKMSPIA